MKEYEVNLGGEKFKAKLKEPWEMVQQNPDYWDFDAVIMELPCLEDDVGEEKHFLVSQISFERDVPSGEFIAAFLTVVQNVPSGNHKELTSLTLDLYDAFNQVFERA